MRRTTLLSILSILTCNNVASFVSRGRQYRTGQAGGLFGLRNPFAPSSSIPRSEAARNQAMASAVKASISSPRAPSCKLIECEFPALSALNKLGDGSLQSAMQADQANLEASLSIARSFLPPPLGPRNVWMVASSSASQRTFAAMSQRWKLTHSLANGLPPLKSRDVYIFVTPSSSSDYNAAQRLAANGNAVVVVNGMSKVRAVGRTQYSIR